MHLLRLSPEIKRPLKHPTIVVSMQDICFAGNSCRAVLDQAPRTWFECISVFESMFEFTCVVL
jgi:hypothetical protein